MKKSVMTAYLFYFCFWCHHIYLGKPIKQILFWVTFGGVGFWALYDLFTLHTAVKSHNQQKDIDSLRETNMQTTQMMQASASQQMAMVATANLEKQEKQEKVQITE